MSDNGSLFMLRAGYPSDWGDEATLHQTGRLGVGLTDSRFCGGASLWETRTLVLNYNQPDWRPYTTVGQYLPPAFVKLWETPYVLQLTGRAAKRQVEPKRAPDIYLSEQAIVVSGRVRDIIEGVEPGRHQFISARVVNAAGQELYCDQQLQTLNVLNWIAPDQFYDLKAMSSHVEDGGTNLWGEPIIRRISSTMAALEQHRVRPEWIDTAHLFITGRYLANPSLRWEAPTRVFISEALCDALKRGLPRGALETFEVPAGQPGRYWQMVLKRRSERT